jgi:hypothetical protein
MDLGDHMLGKRFIDWFGNKKEDYKPFVMVNSAENYSHISLLKYLKGKYVTITLEVVHVLEGKMLQIIEGKCVLLDITDEWTIIAWGEEGKIVAYKTSAISGIEEDSNKYEGVKYHG